MWLGHYGERQYLPKSPSAAAFDTHGRHPEALLRKSEQRSANEHLTAELDQVAKKEHVVITGSVPITDQSGMSLRTCAPTALGSYGMYVGSARVNDGRSLLERFGFSPATVHLRGEKSQNWRPGRFCFLRVEPRPPRRPGAFAWTVDSKIMYADAARDLMYIVKGASCGKPYLDQTNVCGNERQAPTARYVNHHLRQVIYSKAVLWWWKDFNDYSLALSTARTVQNECNPAWNAELDAKRKEERARVVAEFRAPHEPVIQARGGPSVTNEGSRVRGYVQIVPGGLPGLGRRN